MKPANPDPNEQYISGTEEGLLVVETGLAQQPGVYNFDLDTKLAKFLTWVRSIWARQKADKREC